jgi:hypothetical protein
VSYVSGSPCAPSGIHPVEPDSEPLGVQLDIESKKAEQLLAAKQAAVGERGAYKNLAHAFAQVSVARGRIRSRRSLRQLLVRRQQAVHVGCKAGKILDAAEVREVGGLGPKRSNAIDRHVRRRWIELHRAAGRKNEFAATTSNSR